MFAMTYLRAEFYHGDTESMEIFSDFSLCSPCLRGEKGKAA